MSLAVVCVMMLASIMMALWGWARRLAKRDLRRFVGTGRNHPLVGLVGGRPTLRRIGLANWLGFFRFAAGFVVATIYIGQAFGVWSNVMALVLWVPAVLTDAFDGSIARKRGETTTFGAQFDPAADKSVQYLPMAGMAMAIARSGVPEMWDHPLMWICVFFILLRELVLLVVWRYTKTDPTPHWVSKVRSGVMASAVALVALYSVMPSAEGWIVPIVVGLAVISMLFSMASASVESARMLLAKPID